MDAEQAGGRAIIEEILRNPTPIHDRRPNENQPAGIAEGNGRGQGNRREDPDCPFNYEDINKQSKYWAFTINNPTDEEEAELATLVTTGKATYIVWGRENWEVEGRTPHFQGYIELPKLLRRRGVCTLPGMRRSRVGTRYARSTAEAASNYCKKEGAFKEMGVISKPRPGKRTDLDRVGDAILDGSNVRDIARNFPSVFIRYHGGVTALFTQLQRRQIDVPDQPARWERPAEIKSLILHGSSGSGKSTAAKHWLPKALWLRDIDDLIAFDPDFHEGLIFDDMSFKHLPREVQIHLVDWDDDSSIRVRYKLITIPKHTPKIFTCNHWNEIFNQDRAIDRRIEYFEAEIRD